MDVTGAVSSPSVAPSIPNENLYGVTLAADLHRLQETTGQPKDGGPACTYTHTRDERALCNK